MSLAQDVKRKQLIKKCHMLIHLRARANHMLREKAPGHSEGFKCTSQCRPRSFPSTRHANLEHHQKQERDAQPDEDLKPETQTTIYAETSAIDKKTDQLKSLEIKEIVLGIHPHLSKARPLKPMASFAPHPPGPPTQRSKRHFSKREQRKLVPQPRVSCITSCPA